jgi:hypothetical protein
MCSSFLGSGNGFGRKRYWIPIVVLQTLFGMERSRQMQIVKSSEYRVIQFFLCVSRRKLGGIGGPWGRCVSGCTLIVGQHIAATSTIRNKKSTCPVSSFDSRSVYLAEVGEPPLHGAPVQLHAQVVEGGRHQPLLLISVGLPHR